MVEDQDLDVFFDHQADPEAVEMAAFPTRNKDQFAAHWAKTRADDTAVLRTIVADGTVAGNIVSWEQDGRSACSATGSVASTGAAASRRRLSRSSWAR